MCTVDEAAQKRAHAKAQAKTDGDYRAVFDNDAGKRVLRHLMNNNFVWAPTTDVDPQVSAVNEGRRLVVLNILDRIRYKPDAMQLMEAYNEAGHDYDHFRGDNEGTL